MDYQNAEFYKLNKNNPDLVFNYATGTVTYRKEATPKGKLRIVEYRKDYDKKETTRRVVPSYEFSVEDFDIWKQKLVDEALEYRRHDDITTRENVSIENLLDTDLISTDTIEDELRRKEEEKIYDQKLAKAKELMSMLTPIQRERYYKHVALGKSPTEIAAEEGVAQQSVFESIERAKARIEKLKKKESK